MEYLLPFQLQYLQSHLQEGLVGGSEELLKIVKGPDFPTKGLIVGRSGIEEAYRTGRGSITMRAVVQVSK